MALITRICLAYASEFVVISVFHLKQYDASQARWGDRFNNEYYTLYVPYAQDGRMKNSK